MIDLHTYLLTWYSTRVRVIRLGSDLYQAPAVHMVWPIEALDRRRRVYSRTITIVCRREKRTIVSPFASGPTHTGRCGSILVQGMGLSAFQKHSLE